MAERSLRDIQEALQRHLTNGDEQVRELIVGTPRFPIETRLGIYSDAYRLRLIEALSDAYPAVHTLLGDEGFAALGAAYLEAHPSSYRSIRWFGDQLAHFLAERPPWRDTPLLAEMADFEWALRGAFDAPDARPLERETLRRIPPERWAGLRLRFAPSLQALRHHHWNTVALWRAIEAESDPIPPQALPEVETWAIWRSADQRTRYRSLPVDEAWALGQMREGVDFSSVCAGLVEWIDEAHIPARAAGFLHQWLEDELIADIDSVA